MKRRIGTTKPRLRRGRRGELQNPKALSRRSSQSRKAQGPLIGVGVERQARRIVLFRGSKTRSFCRFSGKSGSKAQSDANLTRTRAVQQRNSRCCALPAPPLAPCACRSFQAALDQHELLAPNIKYIFVQYSDLMTGEKMSLICTTITKTIQETIFEPIEQLVSKQETQCKKLPKWNPLRWLCVLVTIIVKVIVTITKTITVVTTETVCNLITYVIGWILLIFAVIVDALCQTCNMTAWVKKWFLTPGRVIDVKKTESASRPGYYDYSFICRCNGQNHKMAITAQNDDEAEKLIRDACLDRCGS